MADAKYQFVVGLVGTQTHIECIYTEDEWWKDENLPPMATWEHVTVASEDDADKWIEAKNMYLTACWTPNQEYGDRERNGLIMEECKKTMATLEIAD